MGILLVLGFLVIPAKVNVFTNPKIRKVDYERQFTYIQDNSLKAFINPVFVAKTEVLGALIETNELDDLLVQIKEEYPDIAKTLICMWGKESTYGLDKYIRGDNGLAYGDFQIHISKHNITEECAMNFKCSLDFTATMIKENKGYLWSSYFKCH